MQKHTDMMLFMTTNEESSTEQDEATRRLRNTIGARVKRLRENSSEGLSQGELAKALLQQGIEVKQGQIGHIESGARLPSVPLFIALADYFATSLDYIAGRTENDSSLADIEEDLQTGGISGRLGEMYKRLPKERQQEAYQFVQALDTLSQAENEANDTETLRFVRALLDSFQKRIGAEEIESALDELAREFPALTAGLDHSSQPSKKNRRQT